MNGPSPYIAADPLLCCLASGDGLPGDPRLAEGRLGIDACRSLPPAHRAVELTSPAARAAAMDRLMAFYGPRGEGRTRLRGPA